MEQGIGAHLLLARLRTFSLECLLFCTSIQKPEIHQQIKSMTLYSQTLEVRHIFSHEDQLGSYKTTVMLENQMKYQHYIKRMEIKNCLAVIIIILFEKITWWKYGRKRDRIGSLEAKLQRKLLLSHCHAKAQEKYAKKISMCSSKFSISIFHSPATKQSQGTNREICVRMGREKW